MSVEHRLLKIMSLLFEREIKSGDDLSMDTEELWDSLKHIEIIITVEEEFEISFNPDDIPKLTSFDSLVAKINELT